MTDQTKEIMIAKLESDLAIEKQRVSFGYTKESNKLLRQMEKELYNLKKKSNDN